MFFTNFFKAIISQGSPAKCTAIKAFVFFVMAFSTSLGFIFLVSRSTSINTGSQPHGFTTFAVETHVKEGIITSPY